MHHPQDAIVYLVYLPRYFSCCDRVFICGHRRASILLMDHNLLGRSPLAEYLGYFKYPPPYIYFKLSQASHCIV